MLCASQSTDGQIHVTRKQRTHLKGKEVLLASIWKCHTAHMLCKPFDPAFIGVKGKLDSSEAHAQSHINGCT